MEKKKVRAINIWATCSFNLLEPSGPVEAVLHAQLYGLVSQLTSTL